MKAAVFDWPHSVSFKETANPFPAPDEVIIKVKACGLCGSDYHIFEGSYPAIYPLVPGHEFAGIIHGVGSNVTDWEAGQKVVADPNIYCGRCYYCLSNQGNMCENANAVGVTRNGAFAEYVAVPAKNLYLLPEELTFEEGALVEPLSCVIYGMQRLKVRYGDRAILFGAGPMGLLLLQALKTSGASEIVVVDLFPERLIIASQLGAHQTCKGIEGLKEIYKRGFDIVVDATGNPKVIEEMFNFAGPRARILQFGCAPNNAQIKLSPFQVYNFDWEYIGTRALLFTFNRAINLLKNKVIKVEQIITSKISLEKVPSYFINSKPSNDLKTVIIPD